MLIARKFITESQTVIVQPESDGHPLGSLAVYQINQQFIIVISNL